MKFSHLPVVFRPMQEKHIAAVMEIERTSFPTPWPEHAYRHEISTNRLAHYFVLCPSSGGSDDGPSVGENDEVWGFAGIWLMVDEAHISTLAIRPDLRRRGLGQLLLLALLDASARLGAKRATLEVRESNAPAQSLYLAYGFQPVGRRKGYYTDNQEDAIILTTPDFDDVDYNQLMVQKRMALARRASFVDQDTQRDTDGFMDQTNAATEGKTQ